MIPADLATRLAEALDLAEQQASGINLASDWYEPGDLSRSHRDGGAGLPGFDEAHIVAWSPRRVLKLIARDRALLGLHQQYGGDPDDDMCRRCGDDWACRDVQAVADFWLEEAADA